MSLQSQGWVSAMCVPRLAAGSGRGEQQCQQAVSHPTAVVFARPGWGFFRNATSFPESHKSLPSHKSPFRRSLFDSHDGVHS